MKCEKLFETIDALTEEYLTVWEDICNLESPTDCKAGVDAVGAYLIRLAEARGWRTEVLPQAVSGDCVCLTMNPEATGAPVSLSGHMDTVHPLGSFGSPAVHREGDRIYGPGVTDCKGGIVAAFLAMDALDRCGFRARPVHLLLQSDEEISSVTSNKETVRFMVEKSRGCVAFLNCEGNNAGQLTVERKGILRYEFAVKGRAAHSSKCSEGTNAICEAAHKILALEKWKDAEGISCNCGVIEGGTVANTVAEECRFLADIRYRTVEQMAEVEETVRRVAETSYLPGSSCVLTEKSRRVAMERTGAVETLFRRICEIYDENGIAPVEMRMSTGGSDAADMAAAGLPVVDSIGVRGGRIHSRGEYAYVESLAEAAKRLAAITYCI